MSAHPSLLARVLEHEFSVEAHGPTYWQVHGPRILRSCAGHLGAIRRDARTGATDGVHDDYDAIGFAAARAFHAPAPGWIPRYQETAVQLAKLAEQLDKEATS